jgi:predicted DNA-binding transcriptional regulator AlpA
MDKESLVMTIPEFAQTCGISRGTAYTLARQDALPVKVIKLGQRRMVVSRKSVEELLNGKADCE